MFYHDCDNKASGFLSLLILGNQLVSVGMVVAVSTIDSAKTIASLRFWFLFGSWYIFNSKLFCNMFDLFGAFITFNLSLTLIVVMSADFHTTHSDNSSLCTLISKEKWPKSTLTI